MYNIKNWHLILILDWSINIFTSSYASLPFKSVGSSPDNTTVESRTLSESVDLYQSTVSNGSMITSLRLVGLKRATFVSSEASLFDSGTLKSWLISEAMWLRKLQIGFACHLPPPTSNHDKCPPSEVRHSTVYGFCLNSPYGVASFTAI
jgi:hypothetical protein